MADIGKITPAFENGEQVRQWRVPIAVFIEGGEELEVTSVYEDEGFLCIDVKPPQPKTEDPHSFERATYG